MMKKLTFKQRMFRIKPYTKCQQCIRTDHIKCKNCMDVMINDIMQHKDNHAMPKFLQRRNPRLKRLFDQKYPIQNHQINHLTKSSTQNFFKFSRDKVPTVQQKQTLQINSKYELWMRHVQFKNHELMENKGLKQKGTMSQWPIKKKVFLSTSQNHQNERRFQNWQKRFMQRVQKIQTSHSPRTNKCPSTIKDQNLCAIKRQTKTAINKLR